jgi:hypothetical protein
MARSRVKRKDDISGDGKQPVWPFLIIIFLLSVQTVFLFYKNKNFVFDFLKADPNLIFADEPDFTAKEQNSAVQGNGDEIKLDPKNIRVSVLNGCGAQGLASVWKEKLRKFNYDIRETGNASQRYEKTLVLSRKKDMEFANHVAENIGVKKENIIMQLNKDLVDIDVTVIVGADHNDFKLK